jgi:hypothetical protein
MDDSERIQRVVGVLTETGEYKRKLLENPDHYDHDGTAIDGLLRDILRMELDIPAGATLQDIAALIGEEMGPVIYRLLGCFALAFHELAEVHDAGQTDVSSAEVLRRLALKAEEF